MKPSWGRQRATSAKSKQCRGGHRRNPENPETDREKSGNIDEALLNISEAAKGLAQTTRIINESLLDKENLPIRRQRTDEHGQGRKELPGLMEETRTSVAAMKETIRNARKIIDGVESRLEGLDPAIKEIPSTLTALRKASDHIASVTADARKTRASWACCFMMPASGPTLRIHPQPERLRHSPLPESE